MSITLRSMRPDDVPLIELWDEDPDVAASGGADDWYDWPVEVVRDVAWRELLIAEERGRPVGFEPRAVRQRGSGQQQGSLHVQFFGG